MFDIMTQELHQQLTRQLKEQLKELVATYTERSTQVNSLAEVEALREELFHRKTGTLTGILRSMKDITDINQKKAIGQEANSIKKQLEQDLANRSTQFSAGNTHLHAFDPTLPAQLPNNGHQHVIRSVQQELTDIFRSMGFSIFEGNELENERYCFEYLNIPATHPARDLQDTFYVQPHGDSAENTEQLVMRTHTSNMQVRIMEQYTPPLRVVVPGRTFRNEATDATHDHTFYQMEGFVVDKDISVANLTYVLKLAMTNILQREIKIRLRPGYFPYVEPGFEVDCYTAQTGWVEMLGCGMIHPKVFESAGYSAGEYTGFAFGMGITRLAMMKYGITDIRLFMNGDLRFIDQFN